MNNLYSNIRNLVHCINIPTKHCCTSALYVTGNKAQSIFSVLTPHIDFDNRIQNKKELEENIKLRELNINIEKLQKQWEFYKHIDETKNILEYTKNELHKEISTLQKNPEGNEEEIEKLKLHAKLTKNDYKNIREYLYGIEEMAVLKVLSLPNVLHSRTPPSDANIIHEYLEFSTEQSQSHVDLGLTKDLVQFNNPSFAYLKNDAALFELAVINYANNFLLDSKFIPFSNSNFARSVVVEGCGTEFFNKNEIFTLENNDTNEHHDVNRTHLTGGASLYSFMAYFTKHCIQKTHFPLKFFTTGRNYTPSIKETVSLFNLAQYTQINCFIATTNEDNIMNDEFDLIVNQIKNLYESLGYHFRLVYQPANQINKNESLRLSVEMYSNHLQKYVEVGYISIYEDFISKRLLFNYNENKDRKFPKIISGNILNIQKLLACVIEYNAVNVNESLLNDLLKQYVPV